MFRELEACNKHRADADRLGVGMKMFELRSGSAFDLLDDKNECFIREGPDGRTHIRGKTEKLENNKVRVRPIETVGCWSWEEAKRVLADGLRLRSVGTSTVHDESSRTHAVLQLGIVTAGLLQAREETWDREAELFQVRKHATDVYIEEHMKGLVKDDDGGWKPNPVSTVSAASILAWSIVKAEYEARVAQAVQRVEALLGESTADSTIKLSARVVFVDLAGAEFNDNSVSGNPRTNQGSPLTMVLGEHFTREAHASMIVTVSTEREQAAATLNTLRSASTAAS
ncbi:P-loop containing nucleoside triphosphate hydrolase protein [Trametes elegans]|nr:P-loop containing nucleoside triphosphate hydrolase protein [Trametes elegans]